MELDNQPTDNTITVPLDAFLALTKLVRELRTALKDFDELEINQ